MGAIFLSYAREDRACAERLARVLTDAGHDLWWDRHIDGGSEFAAEIEAELDKADVVLVLWSAASVRSRWVRDEAAAGGDTGRLVPLSVGGAQPPMGFRQFHTLDLGGWKGAKNDKRTVEVLQAVERRLTAKGDPDFSGAQVAKRKSSLSLWAGRPVRAIAAALVLLVAVGIGIFLFYKGDRGRGTSKPTIALAPFNATTSSDAVLRDLAARTRESLSHTLSQSGVTVKLLSSAPQGGSPPSDYVISGELSRNGDKVVASIRLDETTQGSTLLSKRFEAAADDVRNLPERVGAQMAGNLGWAAPLMTLGRRHRTDPALTADLLQANDFTGDPLQAYQVTRRAAATAPNSALAQISLAFNTTFVIGDLPRSERTSAVIAARRAADRGLELAPEFGDTYGAWCGLHSETRRIECEDRLRVGRRVDADAPFLESGLSQVLRSVGRYDEAVELTRLSYAHDPYLPTKIGWMLRAHEFVGASREARGLYQKGVRWWPEYQGFLFWNRLAGLLARGDFEAIGRLEKEVGRKVLPPDYRESSGMVAAVKSKSPAAVARICAGAEEYLLQLRCLIAYSAVGDPDGAYALADKLYPARVGRTPAETESIWLDDPAGIAPLEFLTSPASAPLRRDPRYRDLARRVGLLDYWRSGRPPDFCRKQAEPICAQLLKRR